MTLNFGKHKGRTIEEIAQDSPDYLEWVLSVKDILDRNPGLKDAIEAALSNIETPSLILAIPTILPNLGYSIRGGGRMHDGTSDIKRLEDVDGRLRFYSLNQDFSGASRSGRSGYVEHIMPDEDGAYWFQTCTGSVANPGYSDFWMVRKGGHWYDVQDKASAIAFLRGAELDTPMPEDA